MHSQLHSHKNTRQAFTIVELLIVVVVIAILAAITVIAYNGITTQAKHSALKSDLSTTSKKLKLDKVDTGSFPSTKPAYAPASIQYTGGGDSFCITASQDGKAFHMTQDGSIQDGACSGHTVVGGGGESGGTEIAANAPIQSVTSAQCAALDIYTGTNTAALRTVTDNRGGTTRSYTIGKLADNKCWMLDNLKLGSTTGSITLTPADSNVTSNFTLPQLITAGATSHDDPQAIGPVPGDTGTGATNYGYLYNFPAVTAGETRTSLPAGNGIAPSSICPVNWRLPSGGTWNATTNEFSHLNARMTGLSGVTDTGYTSSNYYSATFYPNWQNTGPLKGVFSGEWLLGSFANQGSYAYLWSRSARTTDAYDAHGANFRANGVYPGNGYGRDRGFAVRCLLN